MEREAILQHLIAATCNDVEEVANEVQQCW